MKLKKVIVLDYRTPGIEIYKNVPEKEAEEFAEDILDNNCNYIIVDNDLKIKYFDYNKINNGK